MANAMQCQLWMGNLEANMTESFIMSAFHRMGCRPLAVKVMRNKFSGEPAGYAFVHFQSDEESVDTMHKLNGKPIPGTFPVVRFRLNTASREAKSSPAAEREFSVWVGDLSPDVDDYQLYRVFSTKYSSIKTAKVILDSFGHTKGYGFVRFGSEEEQKNALFSMNGHVGLGTKPIKICTAVPKPKSQQSSAATLPNHPTNYAPPPLEYSKGCYDQTYWQGYGWGGYYGAEGAAPASGAPAPAPAPVPPPSAAATAAAAATQQKKDDLLLVEHARPLDVDKMNAEWLQLPCLWDALEESQWFPHEYTQAF